MEAMSKPWGLAMVSEVLEGTLPYWFGSANLPPFSRSNYFKWQSKEKVFLEHVLSLVLINKLFFFFFKKKHICFTILSLRNRNVSGWF